MRVRIFLFGRLAQRDFVRRDGDGLVIAAAFVGAQHADAGVVGQRAFVLADAASDTFPLRKIDPLLVRCRKQRVGRTKLGTVAAVGAGREIDLFVEKEGKAKRISVTMGNRYNDKVEVISPDLKQGDMVIISGQARLLDGVDVKVVNE